MTHFDPAPVGAARSSKGAIVWFTGLSGAGKTTLNQETASRLRDRGLKVESLDGDLVRQNLMVRDAHCCAPSAITRLRLSRP
jgi:adenylylsulfate kinase-like enzyme